MFSDYSQNYNSQQDNDADDTFDMNFMPYFEADEFSTDLNTNENMDRAFTSRPSRPDGNIDSTIISRPSQPSGNIDSTIISRPSRPGGNIDSTITNRPSRPRPSRPSRPPRPTPPYRPQNNIRSVIQNCMNGIVFVWMANGDNFWMIPTHIHNNAVSGYILDQSGNWSSSRINLSNILTVTCI